ncbi:MAG TPA: spermidine/putrescine ABC transporter permease [Firmicutes bacterium]|nr:spermidine/putrescine ABC transporter permease [Bacillota bacterium]
MVSKWFSRIYLWLMFIFLYAPIVVLVVFSFNDSKSSGKWSGFSLRWYQELFQDTKMQTAFVYTFAIAILSTLIATFVGTLASIGIYKLTKRTQGFVLNVNYLPVISPDIVTAVALMMLFLSFKIPLGFITMLLSHVMFSIPYVILSVLPRLYAMNQNLAEAAMDLGATPMQAIRKVVIPEIMPGIIAGALIAFTMSIDDFVISYFTTGNGVTNLSIEIYSMAKRGIRPTVNALATIMVTVVLTGVIVVNRISNKGNKKEA